jgi:uncharacterized protein (DUF58 family)
MMIRWRGVFGLVFLLPLLLAACAAPVTVERVDPRSVHRELTANVLTVGEESGASRNVLYRWDLTERFESDPEGALAELHAAVAGAPQRRAFHSRRAVFPCGADRKQEYYPAAALAYSLSSEARRSRFYSIDWQRAGGR